MNEPQTTTERAIQEVGKEIERLLKELAKVNAQPFQQADVLTGICTQLLAQTSMVSIFISTKQTQHIANIAEYSEKLTMQTDVLVNESKNLSKQTDRLVDETLKLTRFTRRLYWFTIALGFFAIVQIIIMLFQYSSETHKSLETGIKEPAIQTNQAGK